MLQYYEYGSEHGGHPIVIVHGLFGSGKNWGSIAKALARSRHVICVDQRNHGHSPWHDTHDYPSMAQDIAEVIAHFGGRADVIGHSMGGKATMQLALARPDCVDRLIVADIAPVAYSHSQTQHIDAMRRVPQEALKKRSTAIAALLEVTQDRNLAAFFAQSIDVTSGTWLLNLDVLEHEMPKVIGFPEVSGTFEKPTLFLSGALSDYVLVEHRPRIKELFPNAQFAKLNGAGHWLHAEKPAEFISTAAHFLS